jgi:hypothetical protein
MGVVDILLDEMSTLREKLAEAEKDAARYRWLMADSKRRDRIWEHVLWDTERGEHHSLAAALDTARTAATACERSSPIASGDTQGE